MFAVDSALQRSRLFESVYATRPKIVVLFAAPGFGKSLLAKQITAKHSRVAEIDCATARGGAEFCRAIIDAVGGEAFEGDALDGDALEAWRVHGGKFDAVVFENAEWLEDDALRVMRLCLRDPGQISLVVICTRSYLNLLFTHKIGPTDVVTIDERDLRFTTAEITTAFGVWANPEVLDNIERFTEGWPVAVELCRRAARSGRLDAFLNDPFDLERGRLDGYIASEVIGRLTDADLNALCVLSLGAVHAALLPAALRMSQNDTDQLLRRLPLVSRDDTRCAVHGLLAQCIARHHDERRRAAAADAIDALAEAGDDVAAARLAIAIGDMERAARVLNPGVLFISTPPIGVAEFAQVFDRETLVRYPLLWTSSMLYRQGWMSDTDWRREAMEAWAQVPPDASVDVLLGVANNVAVMLIATGGWEQLATFRKETAEKFARAQIPQKTISALSALFDGLVAVARIQPLDVDRLMVAVAPILGTNYVRATILREIAAPVHRRLGDRAGERDILAEAIRAARQNPVAPILVGCLQDAAVAAWLSAEDELFESYLAEVVELSASDPATRARTSHFLSCIHGEALGNEHGGSRSAKRALALLIGAERTRASSVRRAIVQQAIVAADSSQHVAPMILTRLAAAYSDDRQRFRIEEARALLDDPRGDTIFHRHFTSAEGSSPLEPFINRFRAPVASRAAVRVLFLRGVVRLNDEDVSLSTREFSLLAYLALQQRPVDLDSLVEALWPKALGEDGLTSLRVYVNRIRKRLGDPEVIRSGKRAYGVGGHVVTDLAEVEVAITRALSMLRESSVEPLLALRERLAMGPPAWVANLSGFHFAYPRINELLDRLDDGLRSVRDSLPRSLQARVDAALDEDLAG